MWWSRILPAASLDYDPPVLLKCFLSCRCYSKDWQEQTGVGQTSGGAREGDNRESPDGLTVLQPPWATVSAQSHWYAGKNAFIILQFDLSQSKNHGAFPRDNVATVCSRCPFQMFLSGPGKCCMFHWGLRYILFCWTRLHGPLCLASAHWLDPEHQQTLKFLERFLYPGSRGLQLWSITIDFCVSRCPFDHRCKSGRGFSKPSCPNILLGVVCTHAWGTLGNILWGIFKGIQAQTVANFYLAFEAQLAIIPVINKVKKKDRLLVIYSYSLSKLSHLP